MPARRGTTRRLGVPPRGVRAHFASFFPLHAKTGAPYVICPRMLIAPPPRRAPLPRRPIGDVVTEFMGQRQLDHRFQCHVVLDGEGNARYRSSRTSILRRSRDAARRPSSSPATRPGGSPPTSPPSSAAYEIASIDGPFQPPCFPVNAPGKHRGSTLRASPGAALVRLYRRSTEVAGLARKRMGGFGSGPFSWVRQSQGHPATWATAASPRHRDCTLLRRLH
jgi:hypothetical protein